MHAKSQPRYLDLSPDSNCKVRRVWNFWASRLQRWYNDTSWRTSWNSQVVTNRDIVASSVDHPADNRWQGGGRHTMRLTRKWLGFVTHQTQICHHMLGFVGQQTQICRSIHQLLVTAHRLAGGPVSLWASTNTRVLLCMQSWDKFSGRHLNLDFCKVWTSSRVVVGKIGHPRNLSNSIPPTSIQTCQRKSQCSQKTGINSAGWNLKMNEWKKEVEETNFVQEHQ